ATTRRRVVVRRRRGAGRRLCRGGGGGPSARRQPRTGARLRRRRGGGRGRGGEVPDPHRRGGEHAGRALAGAIQPAGRHPLRVLATHGVYGGPMARAPGARGGARTPFLELPILA